MMRSLVLVAVMAAVLLGWIAFLQARRAVLGMQLAQTPDIERDSRITAGPWRRENEHREVRSVTLTDALFVIRREQAREKTERLPVPYGSGSVAEVRPATWYLVATTSVLSGLITAAVLHAYERFRRH
jgi:hypothetical protein